MADSLRGYDYVRYFDGIAGPYGISSTTEDLFKWDQALHLNKLVTKETQDEGYITGKLTNGKAPAMGSLEYGFGWLIMPPSERGKVYMHTGGYPGYATIISRYVDRNNSVIILTNKWNTFNIYDLFRSIDDILEGKPFQIPVTEPFKKSILLDNAQTAALEGSYQFKDVPGLIVKVRVEQGKIYAQLTNQPEFEVYADSPTSLFYTVVEAKYGFTGMEGGKYNGLTLFQNGKELNALRLK
ncbi:MAG: class A beta-lactamase-related serine hydrolase [Pedobacter sp.]|nr:MAG: class A beta-lactamase-related serine hydrolase [Pedobacter sp.]